MPRSTPTPPRPASAPLPLGVTGLAMLDSGGFVPYRTIEDIDVRGDGRAVPGLVARFYRRPEGDRIASLGHYTYDGRDTLLAWGWVGDPHCAFHAVGRPGLGWNTPRPGCPQAELLLDPGNRVVGLLLV